MRYFVTIGEREIEVDLTGPVPVVDGRSVAAEMVPVPGTDLHSLIHEGRSLLVGARRDGARGRWELDLGTRRVTADVVDERTRAIRALTGTAVQSAERNVVAPMPGLVVRVEVEAGEAVTAGQGVVIVEAMKMENELRAPADGVVARVAVEAGQAVEKGAVLVVLQ